MVYLKNIFKWKCLFMQKLLTCVDRAKMMPTFTFSETRIKEGKELIKI